MEGERIETRDGIQDVEQRAERTEDKHWHGFSSGLITKKLMVNLSLICGGIIVLIWGILGFPRKSEKPKVHNDQKCSEDATICPQGWKRINKNCFFLSEHEATWANGQANCMNQHGTLATVNFKNDLESLMEYIEPFSYWFGLSKGNENKIWMWADGALFINWFYIEEGGDCAFIYKKGISSANCDDAKKYICGSKGICS